MVGEVACRLAIAREDAGAVTVFVVVDQLHGLLQAGHTHHTQHGAKDFFLVDLHAGLDVVKQAGPQEVAFFMACHLHLAAIDHQRCTFGHAAVHIGFDLFVVLPGHQRPHVIAVVRARADLHLGDLDLERLHDFVGRVITNGHHQRNRHAAFTTGAIGCAHQRVDGVGNVGIGHDDGMVLGPAQRLHALAMFATFGVDVFGNRGRAHKAHGLDAGIAQQGVHRFLVAIDHIQHARWQASLLRQLGNEQRAGWIALRGLEHKGVATDHGHGPHPQRHHGRKVKGRDACGHAQRLEFAPAVNARADIAAVLALEQLGRIAGVFHVFHAALQLAMGIGQGLAMLSRDQRGNLVCMRLQQDLELAHHPCTLEWWGVTPGGEGFFRRRNGSFYGLHTGQRHLPLAATCGRVVHGLGACGVFDQLSIHPMAYGGNHSLFLGCFMHKNGCWRLCSGR